MDSEEIAGQLAALNTGAKFTGKTLDRFDRDFERIESEIKSLKDEKNEIEKQYTGIFSELQHKLNEVEELHASINTIAEDVAIFRVEYEDHKATIKDRGTWQTIKSDPVKAMKIAGVFVLAVFIGSIIGWDKFLLWIVGRIV
ncbi:hypothetical protein KAR91_08215 [Candidatus Pacearchaeota archaeon]|nr:hypothetical protein [Candidatus Pacearchaeota archaeon]